jgi:hypothetical protein
MVAEVVAHLHGENDRALERRRVECRRPMAQVMLAEQQPVFPIEILGEIIHAEI